LPGGLLKGFKKTIIDYLKLLENASIKSVKFQKYAGNLAKRISYVAKPAENIKALQNILKNEKIFSGLTKRGPMSQIFLGGAPRLFGDRKMRILMRQTKWWLGFLDYIGIANFVGPDELSQKMSSDDITKNMNEYNKTDQAKQNAESDFGSVNTEQSTQSTTQQTTTKTDTTQSNSDPIQNFLSTAFGSALNKALVLI
jgi:hypothetical protein